MEQSPLAPKSFPELPPIAGVTFATAAAGIRYQGMDAQMAGDLVAMAKPVTKWSTMVQDPASVLRVLRRAIKIAATPPRGPVYVCLPVDVLDLPAVEEVFPTTIPSTLIPSPIARACAKAALAVRPTVATLKTIPPRTKPAMPSPLTNHTQRFIRNPPLFPFLPLFGPLVPASMRGST